MIKTVDRYVFKELLSPFLYSLLVLTLIFLVNFVIRAMDRILGKGLSILVILEYIILNLAWILAIAMPLSVLVAVLLAYGRLATDHEVTAMRSGGMSLPRIMLPAMAFAFLVGGFTLYFNTSILPDVNHRARLLGSDIYRKRPDMDIVPGYFIDNLPDYNIRVNEVTEEGLKGVIIFSKSEKREQVSIFAESGHARTVGGQIIFTLYNGEKHLLDLEKLDDYQREYFDSTRITVKVNNMELKRRETAVRGDREMTPAMMYERIAENEGRYDRTIDRMQSIINSSPLFDGDSTADIVALMDTLKRKPIEGVKTISSTTRKWNRTVDKLQSQDRLLNSYLKQINKYLVEVHKKYAIAVTCLVFVLIGTPLGIMTRKSSGTIGVAMGMFFIYWASMLAGEELADRRIVDPILAMWAPNGLMALIGLWISYQVSRERTVVNWRWIKTVFNPKNWRIPFMKN
ncbi:MAG: LptF/LptG family permease [Candidatus Marinimicrobia bacterium]|nr:LptF/LptG family permease [Candidatus Neomarinimicrobiota bacterium]MCF7851352.1 LptF/LptG family permease [Candidatus Neomarinimicrobiota bacterium]MCF7905170.1 LptF/LptG family permease [Candidatus Neomarinimicrobiota bacterium]